MVVGEKGSGKSTLLNNLINYLQGVQFEDTFRYKIIVEDTNREILQNYINKVQYYMIRPLIPNVGPIILVDTPGFGDPSGIGHDLDKADKIK